MECSGSRSVVGLAAAASPMLNMETLRQKHRFSKVTTTRRGGGSGLPVGDDGGGEEEGVVVILGATGTGKSKLSIDIGKSFPVEVINSDKMQVYDGYDITTNKMTVAERRGVLHHLLGELENDVELSPLGFRSLASRRIAAIQSRKRLPVVAGGSNSYVHALMAKKYDAENANIAGDGGLNYRSCLLWVDVGWEALVMQLDRRVDDMVAMGMVEELAVNFNRSRAEQGIYKGIEKAIGVPEFDKFFLNHSPNTWLTTGNCTKKMKKEYESAVEEIKLNTRVLARNQVAKIECLISAAGWNIRRLDATEVVRKRINGVQKKKVEMEWERTVLRPAMADVGNFVRRGSNGGASSVGSEFWSSNYALSAMKQAAGGGGSGVAHQKF